MIRLALIVLTMGVAGFLICPGKSHDSKKLRADYVRSLRTYEGTPYVWGGENKYGIDCSGLVRGGLIKADYWQGISTLNPRLVRESLSLWWHDSSAEALGAEYRHQTRRLLTAPSINDLDHSKILPGDIAVTTSGVHTLAYIGERTWIEADPHFKLVIIVKTPVKNPWFEEPVKIMRWAQLEVGSAETGD